MKQTTKAISEVPRAKKAFAKRAWQAARFPLMVAGLALTISAASAFCNPACSQSKENAKAPAEKVDTLIASKANEIARAHASSSGEVLKLIETRKVGGSSTMDNTELVRFEGKALLSKYDIMKLEITGSLKRGNYRLYLDKKTSTIYLFEVQQPASLKE